MHRTTSGVRLGSLWYATSPRLRDLNPYIRIDTYETMLRADNAWRFVRTTTLLTGRTTSKRAIS